MKDLAFFDSPNIFLKDVKRCQKMSKGFAALCHSTDCKPPQKIPLMGLPRIPTRLGIRANRRERIGANQESPSQGDNTSGLFK